MVNKYLRAIVLTICISALFTVLTSCEKVKDSTANNMNDTELLSTINVIKLLNDNGVNLTKSTDFSLDLSLCKVSGKMPQPYLSNETGVFYMFYEYEGYGETGDLARERVYFEYPDSDKAFSDCIVPGSGIIGKNIYVCQWYPELSSWADDTTEHDRELFESVVKERTFIANILYDKAFNRNEVTLTGKGDFWEVKMPVEYIYNTRKNEKGLVEIVFISKGQTFLKHLKLDERLPDVSSVSWFKSNHDYTSLSTDDGSLLRKEVQDGFYRVSSSDPNDFNPEFETSLNVKITWDDEESEEIPCTISQIN